MCQPCPWAERGKEQGPLVCCLQSWLNPWRSLGTISGDLLPCGQSLMSMAWLTPERLTTGYRFPPDLQVLQWQVPTGLQVICAGLGQCSPHIAGVTLAAPGLTINIQQITLIGGPGPAQSWSTALGTCFVSSQMPGGWFGDSWSSGLA